MSSQPANLGNNHQGGEPSRVPRPFSHVLRSNLRRAHVHVGRESLTIKAGVDAALVGVLGAVATVGSGWTTQGEARLNAAVMVGLAVESAKVRAWREPDMTGIRNLAECAVANAVNRCVPHASAEFVPDMPDPAAPRREINGYTLDARARVNVMATLDEMHRRILAQALLAANGLDFVRRAGVVVRHYGGRLAARLASDYRAYAADEMRAVTGAAMKGLAGNAQDHD